MVVILHRQHSESSTGAAVDLDGDGVLATWEREYHLTPIYLDAMASVLAAHGVEVLRCEGRPYSTWHEWACQEAAARPGVPVAYCAAHLNSVPGGQSLSWMFYDRRSHGGQRLAEHITETMTEAGFCTRAPAAAYDDRTDSDAPWLYNPLYTIRGIYSGPANLSGVCLEPDTVQHLATLGSQQAITRRLAHLGAVMAHGVLEWLRERAG